MIYQKSQILLHVTDELGIPEPYIIDRPKPVSKPAQEMSLPSITPVDYPSKEVDAPEQGQQSVVIIIDL